MTERDLTVLPLAVDLSLDLHRTATRATSDMQLVASWVEGVRSPHTRRLYNRVGSQILSWLDVRGLTMRSLQLEDVRELVAELSGRVSARSSKATTANVVKSLLSFAHRSGYMPFNGSAFVRRGSDDPLARRVSQRILSEADVALLFRSARSSRDLLLLRVAYYGGLRVSELVSITWGQILPRDNGCVQITALVGKGDKLREVLLPAVVGAGLMEASQGKPAAERVFPLSERRVNHIIKSTAVRAKVASAVSAHWLRHAHASHALARGASVALVSQTLGHASISTTSVYLHARPGESSGDYLEDLA